MEEKLYKKLEEELEEYKKYIKDKGVDFAISKAYELTAKQEIIDCIMYDQSLSEVKVKALLSKENILNEMYDDWLSFDGNMREHINYSVEKTLRDITKSYKRENRKARRNSR